MIQPPIFVYTHQQAHPIAQTGLFGAQVKSNFSSGEMAITASTAKKRG
ncbi:MAG: hypothetical protein H0X31_18355 [Nostocaceae cyanobacterium]|nr:hypothetical protein [Nostocaceae cyanobacterium]